VVILGYLCIYTSKVLSGPEIGPSGVRALPLGVADYNWRFSSLSLLSPDVAFLPEGVIVGFRNFAWGFNSQKK
jgi:hypothetical protein